MFQPYNLNSQLEPCNRKRMGKCKEPQAKLRFCEYSIGSGSIYQYSSLSSDSLHVHFLVQENIFLPHLQRLKWPLPPGCVKFFSKKKNYQLSLPPSPRTTVSSISRFATALESRRSSTASERKGARGLRASLTRGKSLNRSRSKSPFRSFRFRKSKPDADTTYSDDEGGETFRLIGRFREMPALGSGNYSFLSKFSTLPILIEQIQIS